jgi:aspartyl-tRNA(Asn)/glutamyl-tRNA(Gln) amidotransferase subunit B
MKDYGLSEYDAKIIVAHHEFAKATEERLKKYPGSDKKPIVNWSIGPILEISANLNINPHELKIPGGDDELIALIKLEKEGKISNLIAKSVFNESIISGRLASQIIQEKNLFQISDVENLENIIEEVIKENPQSTSDYKKGKTNALMFLVGQAMKRSQGKANPKVLQEILKRRLKQ